MTIAIFGNAMKSETLHEVRHLLDFMKEKGINVVLSHELRQELNLREYPCFDHSFPKGLTISDLKDHKTDFLFLEAANYEPIDFALSVGGDGTFLTSAASIGQKNIPILGINCGHLGFLAEVQSQDVDDILQQLIAGQYTIEQRSLLKVSVLDKSGSEREGLIMAPNALNEIAITAYNLSIGGPLMVPQSRGIILTPIAPHSLTVKPLVVPDDWQFDIKVTSRYDSYMVSVDGRSQSLSNDMSLHIERAPYTIKVVQIGDNSFLKSLRTKLNWGK